MAELLQEKWMKGVAVTTTILAVMTAIASSRGTAYAAKIQLLTALEGSKWSYYQAKSIKQNLAETENAAFKGMALGAVTPEQKSYYDGKISEIEQNVERYNKEKSEIKTDAENTAKENAVMSRRVNQITLSVVFFQIGIMLSSVSALLKRKEMWVIGMVMGCIAAVFLVNGLFLLF